MEKLVVLMNRTSNALKSLFKSKSKYSEHLEQLKLQRYENYFRKMNVKARNHECALISELHAICSDNPNIDGNVQEIVVELYDTLVGDVNE